MSTSFKSAVFNPVQPGPARLNPLQMEEQLARELARSKQSDDKQRREIERICAQSDELKELQNRVKAAYQNKERAAQMAE